MLPRTQRQKEVLDYIIRFTAKHGHEPSYAQIARNFGVSSKATIAKHISALEKRGLIKREHEPGRFALAVKHEDAPANALCEVPLVGRIAAGVPIDAIEDIEMICVPRFLLGRVRPERIYALRVKGDSMIDEHICDGDIALLAALAATQTIPILSIGDFHPNFFPQSLARPQVRFTGVSNLASQLNLKRQE